MMLCRQLGCRIKVSFTDGDVGAAIATCFEDDSGVDVLAGIGGCPEGYWQSRLKVSG